ncbi:MAG: hypothetical protein MN733_05245, partial [Nitrososphaera sp.]|nr:hypothetical protein [Nitrososphaera sp.]
SWSSPSHSRIEASSPEGAQRIPGNHQVWPSIITSRIPPLVRLHPAYDFYDFFVGCKEVTVKQSIAW